MAKSISLNKTYLCHEGAADLCYFLKGLWSYLPACNLMESFSKIPLFYKVHKWANPTHIYIFFPQKHYFFFLFLLSLLVLLLFCTLLALKALIAELQSIYLMFFILYKRIPTFSLLTSTSLRFFPCPPVFTEDHTEKHGSNL